MSDRLLSIYLNDHLAGATAGLELARRMLESNRGTDLERPLEPLVDEIEEDLTTLQGLMDHAGVAKNPVKRGAAWLGERITRLKGDGAILGRSPLSLLIELEAMALGIEGKRGLWQTLRTAGLGTAGVDLEDLIARADAQRALVDRLRLDAVTAAFPPGHVD
jgi:hypothetical protein